ARERTATSGSSAFVSAIARASRVGRKNCGPQCRSDSWTIVKGRLVPTSSMPESLEDPAQGVVQRGRDETGGRQRQQPGEENVAGETPADGREAPCRAGTHYRAGDDLRRRDWEAVVRARPERRAGCDLGGEAVLGLHLVD